MNAMTQLLLPGIIYSASLNRGYKAARADAGYHTVQAGESMWTISRKYGMSLDELIAMNPQIENPDLIFPGQRLSIRREEGGGPETGGYEEQVVWLVNREREGRGLPPLEINNRVMQVARRKSEDMRDNDYFSHTSPTYGSPFEMLKSFGISFSSAAENIARGQRTPASVVNAWMNSPGHRENILNPDFTDIGVGYANGATPYWTQLFIRP